MLTLILFILCIGGGKLWHGSQFTLVNLYFLINVLSYSLGRPVFHNSLEHIGRPLPPPPPLKKHPMILSLWTPKVFRVKFRQWSNLEKSSLNQTFQRRNIKIRWLDGELLSFINYIFKKTKLAPKPNTWNPFLPWLSKKLKKTKGRVREHIWSRKKEHLILQCFPS